MDSDFYKNYFNFERNHWWSRVRNDLIFDLIQRYKRNSAPEVFDYGCGSGYLVGRLQAKGILAYGGDVSSEAVSSGLNEGIANLAVIDDQTIGYSDNKFDFVLAMDVLEHLENEGSAVREIERVLKPGGMAIITVPAYKFLWGIQDEVSHHFRRYTASSIVGAIENNSKLVVIRKTYFNTFLFPAIAVIRIGSRFLRIKNKRQSDFEMNSPVVDQICYGIFNFERKLLKKINFPFGVSIMLILEKHV
jgi:2-polyprenyl-3-methyl-5-hydroxy-6-metoxy-1,4-benzoquinol methylase